MRQLLSIVLVICISLTVCSCGSKPTSGSRQESSSPTVNDVLEEKTSESDISSDMNETQTEADESTDESYSDDSSTYLNVDIDLTAMNANMVYSQVYDMLMEPDSYIGKTVKMNGQFAVYEGEDRVYCACLVADATACCQQGVEFILEGNPPYPDAYPELGSDITVSGIFDTYIETMAGQDFLYIQLIDAELE